MQSNSVSKATSSYFRLRLKFTNQRTRSPQRSHQIVVEVNPLCGQRRSLLAQTGSSNNQTMLSRKFLIASKKWIMITYLDSNANVRRRDVALVPLSRPVTIPTISVIGRLHMQRVTRILFMVLLHVYAAFTRRLRWKRRR